MPNIMDTLITDRTYSDVLYARYLESLWMPDGTFSGTDSEYEQWLSGTKGYYREKDLNRVEGAVRFLYEFLKVRGYPPNIGTTKTNWSFGEIPDHDEMERFINNLHAIRESIPMYPMTPSVPANMDALTYKKANNIEKILLDAYNVGLSVTKNAWYAGMVYAGMVQA